MLDLHDYQAFRFVIHKTLKMLKGAPSNISSVKVVKHPNASQFDKPWKDEKFANRQTPGSMQRL